MTISCKCIKGHDGILITKKYWDNMKYDYNHILKCVKNASAKYYMTIYYYVRNFREKYWTLPHRSQNCQIPKEELRKKMAEARELYLLLESQLLNMNNNTDDWGNLNELKFIFKEKQMKLKLKRVLNDKN